MYTCCGQCSRLPAAYTHPNAGFHDNHLPLLIPLVQKMLNEEGIKEYVAWLTPMACLTRIFFAVGGGVRLDG